MPRGAGFSTRHARRSASEHTLASIDNLLGTLLQDKGDLAAAEPLLRVALELWRETHGDRHPDTLDSMDKLGGLLRAKGEPAAAELLAREALEAKRETLGGRHPGTLASINNLSTLLMDKGDPADEPLQREALEVCSVETLGDRHPDTLISVTGLGLLLMDKGDFADAEPLLREALEVSHETLGDRHPHTLDSMNCLLGLLLMNKGDLGAAEPLVRDALQVRRETVGDRHPDTLCAMSPLGMLLYAKDDLASAVSRCFAMRLTCRARPWAIGTHRHSHLHERPRQAVLRAKGDFAAAEPLLREALGVQRETLGDRHPHTLDLLNNLGRLLKEKGELAAAEPLSHVRRWRGGARSSALGTRTRSAPSVTSACCSWRRATSPPLSRCYARRWRGGVRCSALGTRRRSPPARTSARLEGAGGLAGAPAAAELVVFLSAGVGMPGLPRGCVLVWCVMQY